MTSYAHVVDGDVVEVAGMPASWTNDDDTITVAPPDLVPDDLAKAAMAAAGWLPLVTPEDPDHDPELERVVTSGYVVLDDHVEELRTIEPLAPPSDFEATQAEARLQESIDTLRGWAEERAAADTADRASLDDRIVARNTDVDDVLYMLVDMLLG